MQVLIRMERQFITLSLSQAHGMAELKLGLILETICQSIVKETLNPARYSVSTNVRIHYS